MSEDLEARIKALEEQLTPNLDKMSTMKATNRLKKALDELKQGTQEGGVWYLFDEVEKLDKEILELKKRIKELEEIVENEYGKMD